MGDVVHLRAPQVEPLWREVAGRALRRARQERGLRLREVAGRSGVSIQYLSEVERGLKEPSSEILAAVAGALDLTLLDLTVAVGRTLVAEAGPGRVGGPRAMTG